MNLFESLGSKPNAIYQALHLLIFPDQVVRIGKRKESFVFGQVTGTE